MRLVLVNQLIKPWIYRRTRKCNSKGERISRLTLYFVLLILKYYSDYFRNSAFFLFKSYSLVLACHSDFFIYY